MSTITDLRAKLFQLVAQMYAEGIIDVLYDDVQVIQDSNCAGFIADSLSMFCADMERLVGELDQYTKPVFNFLKLREHMIQLRGTCSSMGSHPIKLRCDDFIEAAKKKDKARCSKELSNVKTEFSRLKNAFQKVIELEQQIRELSGPPQA